MERAIVIRLIRPVDSGLTESYDPVRGVTTTVLMLPIEGSISMPRRTGQPPPRGRL